MALLKDTLIQGSARVTDTLYANTIQGNLLKTNDLQSPLISLYTTINNAFNTSQSINLYTNNTLRGHIGISDSSLGIYSTGKILLRPGGGSFATDKGIEVSTTAVIPYSTAGTGSQVALGTADYRWNGVYSSTGNFNSTTASTSKTTGALVISGGIATGAASYLTGSVHIVGSAASNPLIVREISGAGSTGDRGTGVNELEQGLYLNINGGPVIVGYGDATAGNIVNIQYTQDASSSTTGALRVNGGVGIAKKLYVGSNLSVTGTSAFSSSVTITGDLTLTNTHAIYGILGTFNTTTSTDCGGLSWHEVSAVGPSATVNVNDAPNTDWWYVLRNRHTNTTNNYYTDIALPFNSNGIYYKVIRNNAIQNTGVYNGWVKVLDEFGGIFETSSALEKYGNNTSWVNARDGAIIRRYRNLQGETTASLVNSGNYDTANGRYVAAVSFIGLYYTWSIAQYTNDTLYFDCTNNDHYNSATNQTVASISITTSGALTANKVYGAVWNDYAEYRKQLYKVEPGRVVYDLDDGYILPTDKRLQPGAQVVSDTFGFAIGETEESKTPLAVTGRVLVYTYRDRYEYHAGDAVCSAPNGTVDIMTREEIKEYPDAIIGIVSEIPHYETWGTSNVPVNGRIWIKVR